LARIRPSFSKLLGTTAAGFTLVSITCCPFDPAGHFDFSGDSLNCAKRPNLIDFRFWSTHRSPSTDASAVSLLNSTAPHKKIAYKNPVYNGYFADPFVLHLGKDYYAYGTAEAGQENGRWFPVLHSTDLVHWQSLGGALTPLKDPQATSYWAPEVVERDGKFYMYYSAGNPSGEHHKIRVAVADQPQGPFMDQGRVLVVDESFSVDPHPFKDPKSGKWFLFFSKFFLDGDKPGAGIGMVALNDDMMSTSGAVKTVVRGQNDWQIFQRNLQVAGRLWKSWYVVEGPAVIFKDGQYYCLYSGGCWNSQGYGVGFAHARDIGGPWVDDADADGASVLSTVPGHVLGPGHNCVTTAPDGVTPVIVYHAWDPTMTARRLCIDPLQWTAGGPRCQTTWQDSMLEFNVVSGNSR
jgi:GH43 family beta-xylosidase